MGVRVSTAAWARVLLVMFALMLAYTVLSPSADNEALGLLQRFTRFVSGFGAPYWLVFHITEFTANIVLFVPVGVLIPLALGRVDNRVLSLTILVGVLLSITIELAQFFIPGRVSSVFDVLANTLGTLVGVVCVAVVAKKRDVIL